MRTLCEPAPVSGRGRGDGVPAGVLSWMPLGWAARLGGAWARLWPLVLPGMHVRRAHGEGWGGRGDGGSLYHTPAWP